MLDARLEDGSRVAAMFPPCAVDGPTLTVRKFTHRYTLDDLIAVGTLTRPLADVFRAAVDARHNILISGGTGTGKTTLLNAIAQTIPPEDRVVLIEETSEILIDKPNLVRFEARRAQAPLGQEEPMPAVTIADLVRATLRHRPDRILVGEGLCKNCEGEPSRRMRRPITPTRLVRCRAAGLGTLGRHSGMIFGELHPFQRARTSANVRRARPSTFGAAAASQRRGKAHRLRSRLSASSVLLQRASRTHH
jgi:energy-coupling factor transporter ATP-binding protein EcfA2